MNDMTQPEMDAVAERIVRHFQRSGFQGITEALVIRIHLKSGDRVEIEEVFERARENDEAPPIDQYFDLRFAGFYSEARDFEQAKTAFSQDLSLGLRGDIAQVYFEPAPVVVEDPLAGASRYDLILKLQDNHPDHAVAVLLNDPAASLFDYVGAEAGGDWKHILADLTNASHALTVSIERG